MDDHRQGGRAGSGKYDAIGDCLTSNCPGMRRHAKPRDREDTQRCVIEKPNTYLEREEKPRAHPTSSVSNWREKVKPKILHARLATCTNKMHAIGSCLLDLRFGEAGRGTNRMSREGKKRKRCY